MSSKNPQAGFTLIETIIAILILTIGLICTVAAITFALQFAKVSRNATGAKHLIVAQIEEIENLRNIKRLTFGQIANTGAVVNTGAAINFNGFQTGLQTISTNPGPDGVNGTSDDFTDAGADGTFGTGDDFTNNALARSGYQREIIITQLSRFLKRVQVRVRYTGSGNTVAELSGVSYLNDDSRTTQ
jgi:prepilin-type N-terminal cleavage/methylation domain-containing protein